MPTDEAREERCRKLTQALAGLREGRHPDGTSIDAAKIAAQVGVEVRRYSQKVQRGERRTRQKQRASGIRFKG